MALDAESEVSDAELLARYGRGDRAAARAITLRHAPRLIGLARRMLSDHAEAEDVAQEALLRLWRHAGDWPDGDLRLSAWLSRVAANLCLDRLRRRRERTGEDAPERPDGAPSALAGLARADRAAALHAALAELPDRQRLAIVLRHFDERPNPEIAGILGVSIEAVESLLARGRRDLAARLTPRRPDLELDHEDA